MDKSSQNDVLQHEASDWVPKAYVFFLRVISVGCLVGTLLYWSQLSGLSLDGKVRFDLLSVEARFAYTTLALTLPFAALGLWLGASWGVVVFLACAILQILMHGFWTDLFDAKPALIAVLVFCGIVLAGFTAHGFWVWRQRQLTGY